MKVLPVVACDNFPSFSSDSSPLRGVLVERPELEVPMLLFNRFYYGM